MKKIFLFIMLIATANIVFADDAIILTSNGANNHAPNAIWTPEGEKIAYKSNIINSDIYEIYIMNSDGSDQTKVTDMNGHAASPSWSSDGSMIVFAKSDVATPNPNIFVVDVDGTNLQQLTFSENDWRPDWSHDGSTIILERNWGNASLMAINPDGTNLRVMTFADGPVIIGGAFKWSPDDQSIVFYADDYDPDIYIYTVKADGTEFTRLIQGGGGVSWSPDGSKLAYQNYYDNDIYIYDIATSSSRRLTDDPAQDHHPEWSHNGESIYFHSDRTGNWEIYAIDTGLDWLATITATEDSITIIPLQFGFHPMATDGIDPLLGEVELPPKPPAGIFDARFIGDELLNGTLRDIRNDSECHSEYIIDIQRTSTGDTVTLKWDSLAGRDREFLLQDTVTGTLFNINMKDTTQCTIDNPGITQIKIVTFSCRWERDYSDRWSMVSIPCECEDMSVGSIFPPVISAYEFDNSYHLVSMLEIGKGYWVNLSEAVRDTLYCCGPNELTLCMPERWSMTGTLCRPVTVSEIEQEPLDNIITIYGFDSTGYVLIYPGGTGILEPGQGYWIHLAQAGCITLRPSESIGKAVIAETFEQKVREHSLDIPLSIETVHGHKTISFFISDKYNDLQEINRYFELPPVPPGGVFDVRIARGNTNGLRSVLISEHEIFKTDIDIMSQDRDEKVILRWDSNGLEAGKYMLSDGTRTVDMALADKLEVTESISRLHFSYSGSETIEVTDYSLNANYPNPFNPETIISYSIKAPGMVDLTVFNILGQEIRKLVNEIKQPGLYTVQWDGKGMHGQEVSGGLYLYQLKVNDYVETKKMLFMK